MKIKFTLFLTMTAAICSQSCEKKELKLFDQLASGSSIYFKEAINAKQPLQKTVSFGFSGYSVTDSVIEIPIAITGNPSNVDRTFKVGIADSTSAILNTHYSFMRSSVIRAGRVVDTLLVKIFRTSDMSSQQYRLNLILEESHFFNTKLVDVKVPYTRYEILLDDVVGVSYLWTTYSRRSTILSYFGSYSQKKVNLMMEVLKLPPEFFYDPAGRSPTSIQVVSYSRYMYYWLEKEAEEGRFYKDENGMDIKMGQLAT